MAKKGIGNVFVVVAAKSGRVKMSESWGMTCMQEKDEEGIGFPQACRAWNEWAMQSRNDITCE